MGLPKGFVRVLDDEWCFNMYYRPAPEGLAPGGTHKQVHAAAAQHFPPNPKTGKPVTELAVTFAIYRHLARNYDNPEVRDLLNKYWLDWGLDPLDDETYLHYVSARAKNAFSPNQYKNFCDENPDLPYLE